MDLKALWGGDEVDSPLHLVEHGQHITGITRIAFGHPIGKDIAASWIRQNAGFATKLGRTIAFAFDDRGNGGVIRIDDFELTQLFALGQALRLFGNLTMRVAGALQVAKQALALCLTQVGVLAQKRFRFLAPELNRVAQLQQLTFSLAHQLDEDFALPPALTAETAHDLLQGLVQRRRLAF